MSEVKLIKVSDGLVRVEGVSAEPFLLTGASCQNSLNRFFARRSSYTPEQYAAKRQPYLDAAKLTDWAIVDAEPKPVVAVSSCLAEGLHPTDYTTKPVEPSVEVHAAAPEPVPVAEPPVQIDEVLSSLVTRVEPSAPAEATPEAKSWLERMMAETPDEAEINALANSVDLSGLP